MTRHLTYRYCFFSVMFLAAIFFPLLNHELGLVYDIKSFENRAMAQKPEFNVNKLDPFPPKYEEFYNDHFSLRNTLIRWHNLYNIRYFRKSPLPDKIVIGKDDWLFPIGDEMDSYLGKRRFTAEELQGYKDELEYRQRYLAERNCRFYFMIVPCKASIHSDKIGHEYFRMNDKSWGEQLNEYLKSNSDVNLIDLSKSFKEKKDTQQLYYRLDTHWNNFGAFYAANEVVKVLQKDFPGLKPLSFDDFNIYKGRPRKGNIQSMLGELDIFSEDSVEIIPRKPFRASASGPAGYPSVPGFAYPWDFEGVRKIEGSTNPSMLIISDSFGAMIFNFISENFRKTTKIFDAWQYKLNENIVEGEKPDVMLLMIDEPILRSLLSFPSRPGANKNIPQPVK